jgi:hypothetical protein
MPYVVPQASAPSVVFLMEFNIYGIFAVCLVACAIIVTTLTIVGITNGSILPVIIFCAFKSMLSYSFFIPKLEVFPSSTLFFLLITLLGEFATTFFLFSSVVYIFSLVFLTLVSGFYGFSF